MLIGTFENRYDLNQRRIFMNVVIMRRTMMRKNRRRGDTTVVGILGIVWRRMPWKKENISRKEKKCGRER